MKIKIKPLGISIIISILVIVVIAGLFYYFKFIRVPNGAFIQPDSNISPGQKAYYNISDFETSKLPKNIVTYAKKYKLFEEMYNSDKKVFVYGYVKNEKEQPLDEAFHKEFTKAVNKNEFKNYTFVVYENIEKDIIKTIKNSGIQIDEDSCGERIQTEEELDELINTSLNCYANACIIDNKKNEYTVLPKDTRLLIQILKKDK